MLVPEVGARGTAVVHKYFGFDGFAFGADERKEGFAGLSRGSRMQAEHVCRLRGATHSDGCGRRQQVRLKEDLSRMEVGG